MISAVKSSIGKNIMFYILLKMVKIANIYQVKAWVVIIQIQSEQNWVAIVVWFTFLLSDIANWATILI